MDLTPYKVADTDAVYYISDFVTKEEEEYLIRKARIIRSSIPWWYYSPYIDCHVRLKNRLKRSGSSLQSAGQTSRDSVFHRKKSLNTTWRWGARLQIWGPFFPFYNLIRSWWWMVEQMLSRLIIRFCRRHLDGERASHSSAYSLFFD